MLEVYSLIEKSTLKPERFNAFFNGSLSTVVGDL